jgi:membrane fusion protein (multidrug efflux system)
MVVAGGYKVLAKKSAGGAGGAQTAQGPGAPGGGAGGPGGPGGRRGGAFGGPAMVSVATVQPRTFEDTIEVLGTAKGRQSVTLTAAATQLIDKVRFVDGQHVKQGAVLVELKDTEQDAGTPRRRPDGGGPARLRALPGRLASRVRGEGAGRPVRVRLP